MKNSRSRIGRKPIFETNEHLQATIEDYFQHGVSKRKIIVGSGKSRHTEEIAVPTITGLVLFCGFESRQSFYDYEKREEFSYTIKRARLLIEKEYEEQLQAGNVAGAIFALKNFGWTDKQEIAIQDKGRDYSTLSDDELSSEIDREIDRHIQQRYRVKLSDVKVFASAQSR